MYSVRIDSSSNCIRVHSVIRSEGRAEVQALNHKEGAEPEDCRADRIRRVSHTIHERRG